MAQFHFVEDYQKLVQNLIETHPIDEAMSLAVGGGFDTVGNIEKDILLYAGLKPGMTVLDYGSGSGRLAVALSKHFDIRYIFDIKYIGIDIIDELLDYAASKTPKHYKYIKHHNLSVPLKSGSVDLICAFSLFTHLLHSEAYIFSGYGTSSQENGCFSVFFLRIRFAGTLVCF